MWSSCSTKLHAAHPERAVLATRLTDDAIDAVREQLAGAVDRRGRPGRHRRPAADRAEAGSRSCRPARRTPRSRARRRSPPGSSAPGSSSSTTSGVAGLHRVLGVRDRLADADCLIVVAGMEGALPSVVGGLTGVPLVAVPTSVGYGASFGGLAALLAMLNSARRASPSSTSTTASAPASSRPGSPATPPRAEPDRVIGWIDASPGRAATCCWPRWSTPARTRSASGRAIGAVAPERTEPVASSACQRGSLRRIRTHVEVADSATPRGPGATSVALIERRGPAARASSGTRARSSAGSAGPRPRSTASTRRGALPRGRRARLDRRHRRRLRRHRRTSALDRDRLPPVAVGSGTVATAHGELPRARRPPSSSCCEASRRTPARRESRAAARRPAPPCSPHWVTSWGPQPPMRSSGSAPAPAAADFGEPRQRGPRSSVIGVAQRTPARRTDGAVLRDERRRPRPAAVARDPAAAARGRRVRRVADADPDEEGPPAHTLSVCSSRGAPPRRSAQVIFAETSAIGLRELDVGKHALDREFAKRRRRRPDDRGQDRRRTAAGSSTSSRSTTTSSPLPRPSTGR